MKRKRILNEESNNNTDKKMRVNEEVDDSDENAELDNSLLEKKEFVLTREIADNSILCDITGSNWRIGAPVGKGSFGEIYLASNDISKPVDMHNANYVTKIEPHSNGPLFVEIHCLLNVNKENVCENEETSEDKPKQNIVGIPKYIASGSHYFNDSRYRFLIMPRYKADLHSITKHGRLSQKHFLIIASRVIDVLQQLHEKFYVHSDIKAQNVMIGQYDTSINGSGNSIYSWSSNQQQHQQKQTLMNGVVCNSNISGSNNNYNRKSVSKSSVQFSGSNPLRSCRLIKENNSQDKNHHSVYDDMVRSHYLRPGRTVDYAIDEISRSSHTHDSEISDDSDKDEDFELGRPRKKAAARRSNNNNKMKRERKSSKSPLKNTHSMSMPIPMTKTYEGKNTTNSDDHVHIIDYGLATKYVDTNGEHRPFCMDQRRAHDGTIEFTSRDAHFGAHSRRSDLECFGYNLIYWSQGYLPWKDDKLKEQPEIVHRLKEIFMTDVKEMLKLLYGKDVPKYLGDYMHYVGQLEFDEEPNYAYLKGLFEKEFLKLGFSKSDMKLNLIEIREECEPIDKSLSEHDLMMANITDLKTVTKLGFLVASTDGVDGAETLVKPKESIGLNLSCKASPKNLRSKEKSSKGSKRPKRQRKVLTEKEIVSEKMAKGKKLSIQEIAILDPEQIARDRAEKEYEKFDEKVYYQTPQRYKGNPTYAILEIENRLRNKQNGSAQVAVATTNAEVEPIKGYTKPMMDILKKQQMIVEQQMVIEQTSPISMYQKRNREGLRNVIKHTQKNITYQSEVNSKKEGKQQAQQKRRSRNVKSKVNRKLLDDKSDDNNDNDAVQQLQTSKKSSKRRGRPYKQIVENGQLQNTEEIGKRRGRPPKAKINSEQQFENQEEMDDHTEEETRNDNSSNEATDEPIAERKRKARSRTYKNIAKSEIAAQETEEDSVYYDIPGEGSNDGINATFDNSEDDEEDIQPLQKRLRKRDISGDEENSNHSSTSSGLRNKRRGRYYNDDDFEVFSDEASNQSSISFATKSSTSFKPSKRVKSNIIQETGKVTRNKTKSRSTSQSRSVAIAEHSDEPSAEEEEEDGSEFELDDSSNESEIDFDQDVSEEENGNDNETDSELDDDEDSIDIKYSPIKTRHARRRITCFNMKQIRGRRMNMLNEDVRNFRLVSTRG